MDKIEPGSDAIQWRGLRLTSRRQLVLEILRDGHEHLDAEKVYERARHRDPHISLATVYRTLALAACRVRQSNWQGVKGESPHIQRFSKPE